MTRTSKAFAGLGHLSFEVGRKIILCRVQLDWFEPEPQHRLPHSKLPVVNCRYGADMAAAGQVVLDVLEALGCGGVLLDKKGRVLQTNPQAARYLGTRFNLKRRGGGPEGTINEAVQDGLRIALKRSAEVAPLLGDHIVVPRADSRPLLLRQLTIPGGLDDATGELMAAIVVLDMEDCPHPDEDLLRDLFLLTPAEARVATRLSCGQDLASIARDLGVSRGTVRVHLKSLFWKTATRRQGELIALLAHLSKMRVAKS